MKKWSEEGGGGNKKEPPPKKQQNLGEKLKKIAGKRGGQFTPVLPFLLHTTTTTGEAQDSSKGGGVQDSNLVENPESFLPCGVSARKLGATVWELYHYNFPFAKMHNGGGTGSRRNHRYLQQLNRHHHHHHRQHLLEDNPDPLPELGSASSLRRHVAASLMQHQQAIQRNHNAVRAVSPASYGSSSMEVAPYNPAVTPTSSIEFRGGNGETGYSLKTSTELLKVLNRIWSLEELHAANITLVRDLKRELELARSKIKELARDRHEMEHLMKQLTEDKQGHATAAIQSVRDELEDERKLRKRSETLHRKLARELYETKTTLVNAIKDLEKERRSRVLLEDLCDEFAWGIKNYEHELHSLKHVNPDKGNGSSYRSTRDGMILHISESWLDERMQMKQDTASTKESVVEKLSSELEAFLEAKRKGMQKVGSGSRSVVGPAARRRHSLESIPMNLATSAPPDDGDDDDDNVSSAGGDSPCFELDKHKPVAHGNDDNVSPTTKPDNGKKKLARDPSSLQVKFEEQMAKAILGQEQGKMKAREENHTEITEENVGLNSKYLDSLLKNHHLQSGNEFDESANKQVWKSHPSPVRAWTTKLPIEDLKISESSSKVKPESKEQTSLKSKLLEARTRGHRLVSRVKK
ncbi:putative protein BRANCHLESS TRICHOME [Helianthus annuus]|uniref:Uncharacterized protein n=1 Tax=Helianthus annuus TaxID=4232 RepID=A0A251RL72_HELAN|nr:uncharacterized protein At5g41620 [Helianthus annuus]KAF5824274.1 hypothetical protein HanXRQr2_Chr00c010g0832771 [Helianthus annuus]KAJ0431430.1 putative protein BRANCHLESS TRICHOME [Helianthus annuus]KAJ0445898.1 putative protein BRANCHLESS TRICHOME [Helianthus annuus]KAJ0824375.1 putative protein BRANCHLESS TRICHOME [Helianthus annuus]